MYTIEETEPANFTEIRVMEEVISAYLILWILGFICFLINIPLLFTFLISKKLRADSTLLICLACGDIANCIGQSMMGFDRYTLFAWSLDTKRIPIETSLTCAEKTFIWFSCYSQFRLIGNIWPPMVQMIMGTERFVACMLPIWYTKWFRDRTFYLSILSIVLVIILCAIALLLAVVNESRGSVKFDCGRKATFSEEYAQFVYFLNMLGYMVGLGLNILSYLRLNYILKNDTVRDQLKRVRYYLAVGVLSTVLVAIPNLKSLFGDQLRIAGLDEWISQAFNWASLVNSSINICVYLAFHREFRQEFARLFGCEC
uniref:G_PROTEIN_RECEP_F1_2 domain-containing protein n=1 Tax=Heterorhabditis bacteriophora TaxID=37862 RepID=A0A1I7WF97_HETBA